MIYGDHSVGGIDFESFHSDKSQTSEYVPFLIFHTEENLASIQATRNMPIALDGRLSLLDMITYLKGQIQK